jgi:hypothetical protein
MIPWIVGWIVLRLSGGRCSKLDRTAASIGFMGFCFDLGGRGVMGELSGRWFMVKLGHDGCR